MQLDVVWLFDSFEGNGGDGVDLTEDMSTRTIMSSDKDGSAYSRAGWNSLKVTQLVSIRR